MVRTDGLGNDPRWGEALRKLSAEVIATAPPSANAARCTISGATNDFECALEFGPNIGSVIPSEKLQYSAAELVGVWFDHNSDFDGLELSLLREPAGDWQINIDLLKPPPRRAAAADGWDQDAANPSSRTPDDDSEGAAQENSGSRTKKAAQRRMGRTGVVLEQKQPAPPWVKAAIIAVVALVLVGSIGGGVFYIMSQNKPPPKAIPFEVSRKSFETELTKRIEAPQEYDNTAPDQVKVVEYDSGDRKLMAWLVLPERDPPFPAVVFVHDGFALSRGDYDSAMRFVDHGFAVLIPSFRGENGNPGDFEMCYGEVDDLVNAIDYMATRKKVDPKNIFAAGHGVGATNVMLAAELSPHLKKVACLGSRPDMVASGTYENAPFDSKNEKELLMRSPARFANDLKCPMLLLYSEQDSAHKLFQEQAKAMEKECKTEPILVEELPGVTHESALSPAITRMLTFFHAR